jgi:hypothetical protein
MNTPGRIPTGEKRPHGGDEYGTGARDERSPKRTRVLEALNHIEPSYGSQADDAYRSPRQAEAATPGNDGLLSYRGISELSETTDPSLEEVSLHSSTDDINKDEAESEIVPRAIEEALVQEPNICFGMVKCTPNVD